MPGGRRRTQVEPEPPECWPPVYEPSQFQEIALRRYLDAAARFCWAEAVRPKDEEKVLDALAVKQNARAALLEVLGGRVNRWFLVDSWMIDAYQPEAGGWVEILVRPRWSLLPQVKRKRSAR